MVESVGASLGMPTGPFVMQQQWAPEAEAVHSEFWCECDSIEADASGWQAGDFA